MSMTKREADKLRKELNAEWEKNSTGDKLRLWFQSIFPPPTPGRGKRHQQRSEAEQFLFKDAVCCWMDKDASGIESDIAEAFKSGDPTVFRLILEAKHYADNPPINAFNKAVKATIKAKIRLRESLGRTPTKAEVKEATGLTMEPQRWTEVFRAANLGYLPNAKPRASKQRHGDRTKR